MIFNIDYSTYSFLNDKRSLCVATNHMRIFIDSSCISKFEDDESLAIHIRVNSSTNYQVKSRIEDNKERNLIIKDILE